MPASQMTVFQTPFVMEGHAHIPLLMTGKLQQIMDSGTRSTQQMGRTQLLNGMEQLIHVMVLELTFVLASLQMKKTARAQ
jgi:hypothetical protein